MSKSLCLDTSYLVGLFDDTDVWHPKAREIQLLLEQHQIALAYVDCVLNELFTVLARRSRERGSPGVFPTLIDRVVQAIPETTMTWLYPHLPHWYNRCLNMMRETQGHLNFHDSLIVVAMQEMGLPALVSFDSGFDQVPTVRRLDSPEGVTMWLGGHC